MRISSLFMMIAAVLMLGGCGMNASSSDAPKANQAHESTWVTYHRDAIVSGKGATVKFNGLDVIDANLINEHLTQCKVCHGADFMGTKGGAAGPACLDCHVLDPVKFPVMCYSCHGGWPAIPTQTVYQNPASMNVLRILGWPVQPIQGWYSTVGVLRGGLPIDPTFISRVRSSNIHLKHKAIPNLPYDATFNNDQLTNNNECGVCHGGINDLGYKHHNRLGKTIDFRGQQVFVSGCLAPLQTGGGCHTLIPSGGGGFTLQVDCIGCHGTPPEG